MTTTNKALTETQVETLWRAAVRGNDTFLESMCEGWLDREPGSAGQISDEKIIRSYIKGSSFEALVR